MMRKITFLVGAGVGFVLGSRAGSGPYQQLEAKFRNVGGRPEVQGVVERATAAAKDRVNSTTENLQSSHGQSTDDSEPVKAADSSVESYADPQDLQFSVAAAEKEELVDALLADGLPPEQLDAKEEELRQKGELNEPRAGNKIGTPQDT